MIRRIYEMLDRIRKLTLLTGTLVIAFPVYAQFTGDGFKNTVVASKHDLSATPTSGAAVCEFCHSRTRIPGAFNGTPNGAQAPLLWNVQVKAGPYTTYGGSAIFAATDIRDPSTASSTKQGAYMSLLCLSCHDGSVTAASFYFGLTEVLGTVGTISPPIIGESGGNGLTNDHPVDFTYSAAMATTAGGLQTPTEGSSRRIPYVGKNQPLPLFKDQASDSTGRLECATCHNPHDNTLNGGNYFLRMENNKSRSCLNCHGN